MEGRVTCLASLIREESVDYIHLVHKLHIYGSQRGC